MESKAENGSSTAERVDVLRITREAIKICYSNASRFIGASALVFLPSLLVGLLTISREADGGTNPSQGLIGLVSLVLIVLSFTLVNYFVASLPLMTAYHLDRRQLGWTEAFAWIRARNLFWGVVLAWLLSGLAFLGGFVLLIVPGLVFGTWFFLSVPARVLSDLPGRRALAQSRSLVSPVLRGSMILGAVLFLPWVVIVGVVQVVFSARYGFMSNSAARVIPPAVVSYLLGVFWAPVVGVALALLYIERAGGLSALRKDLFLR